MIKASGVAALTELAKLAAAALLAGQLQQACAVMSTSAVHERCGWFDNPSPGNATLNDRDGEWTIAMQGTVSAKGDWPVFKQRQWVRTGHGSHGHGCACLKVREREAEQRITQILGARAKALSACRRDKALTEPENPMAH